ncbi:MAG: universal stress protein [Prochlorotrichaceae cyanobacterium]
MNRILLCTDGSPFAEVSYQYGAWFAQRLAAAIDVLYVTDSRTRVAARNYSASLGIGASQSLLQQLVELEHEKGQLDHQRAKLILNRAEEVLRDLGVQDLNLIHETGFLVDFLQKFETDVDLIILGRRGETAEFASEHLGGNVERILRGSHKPCLVTGAAFQPIQRLLIAYDGSPSCQKLLNLFVSSPAFQGLETHIISVANHPDDREKAESRLAEARHAVSRSGTGPLCCFRIGHPETLIPQYIKEANIDLLLLGAYGHQRIRRLVIGSTTIQLLRNSPVPAFVFR